MESCRLEVLLIQHIQTETSNTSLLGQLALIPSCMVIQSNAARFSSIMSNSWPHTHSDDVSMTWQSQLKQCEKDRYQAKSFVTYQRKFLGTDLLINKCYSGQNRYQSCSVRIRDSIYKISLTRTDQKLQKWQFTLYASLR